MKNEYYSLHLGRSEEVLKQFPENEFHALITDPPAGISHKNENWDKNQSNCFYIDSLTEVFKECHRVLKPGAYGFVWAYPRTSHLTATALEASGFKIKDILTHVYFNGFPKGLDLAKVAKVKRSLRLDDIYKVTNWIRIKKTELRLRNSDIDSFCGVRGGISHWSAKPPNKQASIPPQNRWEKLIKLLGQPPKDVLEIIKRAHGENQYAGKILNQTTSLKPANEYWILVQKELSEKNIVSNIEIYNTGALYLNQENKRFTNLLVSSSDKKNNTFSKYIDHLPFEESLYYAPRSTTKEKRQFNTHPTVKPLSLMRHLINIVCPENSQILDPFMGSGTTGVAAIERHCCFTGIEQDPTYFDIAKRRIEQAAQEN